MLQSTKIFLSLRQEKCNCDNNKEETYQQNQETRYFTTPSYILSMLFLFPQRFVSLQIHGKIRGHCVSASLYEARIGCSIVTVPQHVLLLHYSSSLCVILMEIIEPHFCWFPIHVLNVLHLYRVKGDGVRSPGSLVFLSFVSAWLPRAGAGRAAGADVHSQSTMCTWPSVSPDQNSKIL